ncbi:MAG: nitrite/sulfite reductase [Rhodospirillaceae bacterium]|jgi:sulfite reductase (NADPH) hemoprotein beta-component|nr:nitrite/sulfite reductase [Rhodospirillaceae bacterium]MBT4588893.1 nitrite/sulfite reductase [Rhodospirillaceae bacterium]MBT7268099.1 nitrite/sulfite reductase [Rhodospirillaceae bacterium]
MYQYDPTDHTLTKERVVEYRDQVARRLDGNISEDDFRPLRLKNGLYMQLHAYMLRVAIPYGLMSADQLRMLAYIGRKYDKGYGHFTTRQNLQFNWPNLEDTPDILENLASVEMSAIQTSGNVNRNVTSDPYAGVAPDEVIDPRPFAEIVRQFITLHPEFSWLPRKFKIAITGAEEDRAATNVHDIGLKIIKNEAGDIGFRMLVGGGLGRSPFIAKVIRKFLPKDDLIRYLQAILRVYNIEGRRDNLYKARIKILVHELGIERFSSLVEEEFKSSEDDILFLGRSEEERIAAFFAAPDYADLPNNAPEIVDAARQDPAFAEWLQRNVTPHKQTGYAIVNLTLKPLGGVPGDITSDQMDAVAGLADKFSFGQIRATHRQNLVLADVAKRELLALWQELINLNLATPNLDRISDIICCPGMDYCSLATARSIPIAQRLSERFSGLDKLMDIGEMRLNISGCINACGHHHVGHIGILGVEKNGEEFYQVTLGGSSSEDADIGQIIGPAFSSGDIIDAVEKVVGVYLSNRQDEERFIDTYRRIGQELFKEALYDTH